jgi:membrane-bound lytic murein transglycosylase D
VFNTHDKKGSLHGYITVQPEESLGLYADWLGTSVTALAGLNRSKSGASLSPGQKVLLVFKQLTPNQFEDKRLDFLQEAEEDFFSAFAVVGQKTYRVSSGDTLWDLCYNKFDIPLWLLERYNSTINLTRLNKEQELIVPIVQSI